MPGLNEALGQLLGRQWQTVQTQNLPSEHDDYQGNKKSDFMEH